MADERVRIRIGLNPGSETDREILDYLECFDNPGMALKDLAYAQIKQEQEAERQKNESVKYKMIRREKVPLKSSKRWFGRKKKQVNEPEYVKYSVEEKQMDDFHSLEDYLIRKKLDPSVMTMITAALEKGIDYGTILSMVENGLNAQQMRGVIEVVMVKRANKQSEKQNSS